MSASREDQAEIRDKKDECSTESLHQQSLFSLASSPIVITLAWTGGLTYFIGKDNQPFEMGTVIGIKLNFRDQLRYLVTDLEGSRSDHAILLKLNNVSSKRTVNSFRVKDKTQLNDLQLSVLFVKSFSSTFVASTSVGLKLDVSAIQSGGSWLLNITNATGMDSAGHFVSEKAGLSASFVHSDHVKSELIIPNSSLKKCGRS